MVRLRLALVAGACLAMCAVSPVVAAAAVPVARDDGAAQLVTRLEAAGAQPGDGFGADVAVQGTTAVVGAPGRETSAGPDSGVACVFGNVGGVWSQQATLSVDDGNSTDWDYLGSAVAVDGDTIVVGAPSNRYEPFRGEGSAHVFVRSGGAWSHQATLTAGDVEAGDWFGCSVAIDGDTAVVGAGYDDNAAGGNAGAVYVFARTGSDWSLQQKVLASDAAEGDCFGVSVDVSGDTVIGGAVYDTTPAGEAAGSARVFTRASGTWTEQAVLTASDAATDTLFGASVAIDGETAVVGSYEGPTDGAAYSYERGADGWVQSSKLPRPADATHNFGTAVALSGDRVALAGQDVTTACLFARAGSAWADAGRMPGGSGPGYREVDIDGRWVLFGSPGEDTSAGTAAGAVYVYDAAAHATNEDTTLWVSAPGVLANDSDADSDTLSWHSTIDPHHGQLSLYTGGGYRYIPDPDFSGVDHFQYRCWDGASPSEWATVTITVDPVNDPPVAVADPSELFSLGKMLASDPTTNAYYGVAAAIDGDYAVVGAQRGAGVAPDTGSVYVYVRDGAGWTQQARLFAPDGGYLDMFGGTVDISGDTIVVGAGQGGHAYVFRRTGTAWSQEGTLTPSDRTSGDYFGSSVTVEGDTILVGAHRAHGKVGADSGAVYAYRRSGSTWSQEATLTGSDTAAGDSFGIGLDQCGDVAVVGAYGHDEAGSNAGSAYVFERDGGAWTQRAEVIPSGVEVGDYYGGCVSLDGSGAVVTAPSDDDGGANRGAAYAFGRSGTTLSEQGKLVPGDPGGVNGVGWYGLAIDGDTIMIGDPYDDDLGTNTGSVREFTRRGSTWSETAKILPPDSSGNAGFGTGIALSGADVIIGSPREAVAGVGQNTGSAHFYARAYHTLENTTLTVPAPGVVANDYDVEDDVLYPVMYDPPSHGVLSLEASGAFTYTPEPEWSGIDRFSYRAYDPGDGMSQPVTVTIVVSETSGTVARVAGSDRYAVAANLALKGWNTDGHWGETANVIVACGDPGKEADPLAAAGLAGAYDCPILLTKVASLPSSTRSAITSMAAAPGHSALKVHIVGGTGSVPDAIWNQIKAIPGVSATKDRITGSDRYAVTAAIAYKMRSVLGTDAIPGALIVCSENPNAFYDALAASPIAFATHRPMLGVRTTAVPSSVGNVLRSPLLAGKPHHVVSSSTYISAGTYTLVGGTGNRLTTSSNRYTAATQIAARAHTEGWLEYTDTGMASALADALGGGAFMGNAGGILLYTTPTSSIQSTTRSWIATNSDDITRGWIFGGTGSVPDSQKTAFEGLLE